MAAAPGGGVDMSKRVQVLGSTALAIFTASTLAQTPLASASPAASRSFRNLKLRVAKTEHRPAQRYPTPRAARSTWVVFLPPAVASPSAHALSGSMTARAGGPDRLLAVTLSVGRRGRLRIITNARSVRDLLQALRVAPADAVRPGPGAAIRQGSNVRLRHLRSAASRLPGRGHPARRYGLASWYRPAWGMVAAHVTLPFGTAVTVTSLENGRSVTVVINDRGRRSRERIIWLSPEAFAQIAPLGQGAARVRLSW